MARKALHRRALRRTAPLRADSRGNDDPPGSVGDLFRFARTAPPENDRSNRAGLRRAERRAQGARGARRLMGRKLGLTLADVVETASAIADEGGIESLNLGAAAEKLGVRPPSLYDHVDGRDTGRPALP